MRRLVPCSYSHCEADNGPHRSTNDVLALEIAAAGTQFSAQKANTSSQAAFETLLDGDLWMIYRNVITGVQHWDFVGLFAARDTRQLTSERIRVSCHASLRFRYQITSESPTQSISTFTAHFSIQGNGEP